MKKIISETIDGSMKDIIQLKTLDSSLEYSQLFDALEDCPNDFKAKLIGALNSLSQTMGVSAEETFNKVLCASDDENAKKKLYNWWRAVFEVVSKSVPNIPEDRRQEYEDKLDALISEICKAGDKASGNDVVLEDYEPADVEDEDKLKEDMAFAASKIGEIAKKAEELVNFLNPYCGTEVNESTMDETEVRDFVKAIGFRPDSDGIDYETQLVDALTGKDTSYNAGWGAVYYNSDKVLQFLKKYGMLGSRGIKQREAISKLKRLFKSGKWKEPEQKEFDLDNEVETTMKKLNERGGSDWVSMDDMIGMEVGESDNGEGFWKSADDVDDLEKKGYWSGKFKVGDKVTWIDPDGDEIKEGWTVTSAPESEDEDDDMYTIETDDGSEAEVYGSELRPALETVMEGSDESLDEYEFLEKVLEDAEDTNDVFDVYDGSVMGDGSVCLNVIVNKDDIDNDEVKAEFGDWGEQYGWKYESFSFSSDLVGDEGTETINVYFRPMKNHVNEENSKMENELKKGDDGWREIGQPVGEAKVTVDANDVWDVLDLLDNDIANKELTNLINSHVRTEEEIMDAIDELCGETISKEQLNVLLSGKMATLVDFLGLDVAKYEDSGEFVEPEKPVTLEGSEDEQKPDEVKDGEKKYKQDGETKTLVTGEDDNKSVVSEMTIEQEINDPWKLLNLLWGQGKDNFDELLRSNLFSDDRIMDTLEQFEVRDLTNLNDLLAFDFEQVLEALGCDVEAWTQRLEIQRA